MAVPTEDATQPQNSLSRFASTFPGPPPLPADTFEMLTPLYALIERVLTEPVVSEGDGPQSAHQPAPLTIKDFASEALKIKRSVSNARFQLRGLQDMDRTVVEQETEFKRLTAELDRALERQETMAKKGEEILKDINSSHVEADKKQDDQLMTQD